LPRRTAPPATATLLRPDRLSATAPIALVCAYLLMMILPPNLDYGALVNANVATFVAAQNLTSKLVIPIVLIGSCVLIMRRHLLWFAELRSLNPFYLIFLLLAIISLGWSIDPPITTRALFRLVVIFLSCTAFTLYGWRTDRFQGVMRPLLGALLVGSVVFAVVLPYYGVQQFSDFAAVGPGRIASYRDTLGTIKPVLRGLTFGKNQMGQLASFGVIFWFHAWLGKDVRTRWVILCGGCALICLYWAHSSTSIIAAAFSVPMLLLLRHWPQWLRRYMPYILVMFTVLILLYSLVVLRVIPQLDFLLTPITAITGKDLTFSDRTAIWQIVVDHISQHPLIGTGYAAYWDNDNLASPSQVFKTLLFFFPGESHNGYLEVLNDLGIVGGLCLLGFLFTFLMQSIRIMNFDRHQGALYVTLLFHQFWSSLSESHWFSMGSVSFTIITLAVCTSARTLLQRRFELEAARPATGTPATTAIVPIYNYR
jgi:exopolysaccharide production protein ExoQ